MTATEVWIGFARGSCVASGSRTIGFRENGRRGGDKLWVSVAGRLGRRPPRKRERVASGGPWNYEDAGPSDRVIRRRIRSGRRAGSGGRGTGRRPRARLRLSPFGGG